MLHHLLEYGASLFQRRALDQWNQRRYASMRRDLDVLSLVLRQYCDGLHESCVDTRSLQCVPLSVFGFMTCAKSLVPTLSQCALLTNTTSATRRKCSNQMLTCNVVVNEASGAAVATQFPHNLRHQVRQQSGLCVEYPLHITGSRLHTYTPCFPWFSFYFILEWMVLG